MSDHYCCKNCNQHYDFCKCTVSVQPKLAPIQPTKSISVWALHNKQSGKWFWSDGQNTADVTRVSAATFHQTKLSCDSSFREFGLLESVWESVEFKATFKV